MLPFERPVDRFESHVSQSDLDAFPSSLEYVSTSHSKHVVCPLPSWYCPAGQDKHMPPSIALYLPKSQDVQTLLLFSGASVPVVHWVQLLWSVSLCANPMGHSVQISLLLTTFLNLPGAQSEHLVLPVLEVRPGGHWSHGFGRFLSVAKEFVWQSVQLVAPTASLNSP